MCAVEMCDTVKVIGGGNGGLPAIIVASDVLRQGQEVIFDGEKIVIADHCCGVRRGRMGGKDYEECFKPSLVMPFAECLFDDTISRAQMREIFGSQILCDSHYKMAAEMTRERNATFYNRVSISANLIARVFGLKDVYEELRYEHILYYLREVIGHLTSGDFAHARGSNAWSYLNFNIQKHSPNFYELGAKNEADLDRIASSWIPRNQLLARMRAETAAMRGGLRFTTGEIFFVAKKRSRDVHIVIDDNEESDIEAPVTKRRTMRTTRSQTQTPTPRPQRYEPAFTRDQLALPHPASMRAPAPVVAAPPATPDDPIQKAVKAVRGFADCAWSSITIGPDGSICIKH